MKTKTPNAMKHISSLLFGALLPMVVALTSCDSISEPDRLVPAEIDPQRAVLIEEFTGQQCTNCPDGHRALQEILASLGDSVVPVSIHASALAMNPPRGMKTEQGEEYYKAAGSPALPSAVVNMQTSPLQIPAWGSAINQIIMTPTPYTVKATPTVNEADGTYDIKVAFSAGEDFEGKLLVWVLENDIVAYQLDNGVGISNYVHNHVFRAAAPDTWGEDVTLKAHTPQTRTYSVPIQTAWDMDNVYVVAFLYNNDGVKQVTSTAKHH